MGPFGVIVIKTTGNIGIHHPRVFRVRSGPKQSYSPQCYWGCVLPPSTGRWREERSDKWMELIDSNQIIELIKSNQGMVFIKLSHDIQLWHLARCSIITYGMTPSRNNQDTQSCQVLPILEGPIWPRSIFRPVWNLYDVYSGKRNKKEKGGLKRYGATRSLLFNKFRSELLHSILTLMNFLGSK